MKQRSHLFWQIALCCDGLVLVVSFFVALGTRSAPSLTMTYGDLYPLDNYLWLLCVIIPTWLWLIQRYHLHQPAALVPLWPLLTRLAKVQILGGLMLLASAFLVDRMEVSRLLTQIFLTISAVLLAGEKLAFRAFLKWTERHPGTADRWKVLVVSNDPKARDYLRLLRDHPNFGVELAGPIPLNDEPPMLRSGNGDGKRNRNGTPSSRDWDTVLHDNVVDEVIAVTSWRGTPQTESLSRACIERGITFRTLVTMPPAEIGKYYVEELAKGVYLLSLETVPQGTLSLALKRLIDIAGALVGLTLCGIAYLWYGPKIKKESPGPIFFRQQRVGQNGRTFTLYKFRTMCLDAEAKLADLREQNEMRGLMFKIKDDPRITPLGHVLRRRHIDELPQFWNVLKGQMSLVGTRPPTCDEVAGYRPRHYRRLGMKPGLTGLWQLNGNGAVNDFEEVVRLDCQYIEKWSLWLDCRILGKTTTKVLRGNGW
jgi:exopolysaccharide biosynthesis polyprenyl glycosylphosphotransferase